MKPLSRQITRKPVAATRAKTRVNDKNRKVCAKAMEYVVDKGRGPNPYCNRGYGQNLCKSNKSLIAGWGGNEHIVGDEKDGNGRNWKWTMSETKTDYYAVDCSGLTRVCYQEIGRTLYHQSDRQSTDNAAFEVPVEEAQPGDLIYKPGHVAIVGEDGIHACEAQDTLRGCTYTRKVQGLFQKCYHFTGEDDPTTGSLTASQARSAIIYNKANNQSICREIQAVVGVEQSGSFDTTTVNAIAAWQKENNIRPDGKFGDDSKKAANIGGSSAPITSGIQTGSTVVLTQGQQESAISYNKRNNLSICRSVQALVGVTVNGMYDVATVNAIAAWQASKGLPADGKFGPQSKAIAGL